MVNHYRRIALLAGLTLAVVFGSGMTEKAFAEEMTTEETRALMKDYLKYHQSGDPSVIDKWGAYYADDIEAHYHTVGPLGHYFFGKEGFLDWYKRLSENMDFSAGMKVDHRALIVDGNVAVIRHRVRSRQKSGVPYINEYVHIYTWRDGKIVFMEAFYNGESGRAAGEIAKRMAGQ